MNKLNFKKKWVIVTGASSGLGQAIARRLATKEQANLIITARREKRLQDLKKELETTTSSRIHIIPADLSDPEAVNQLFQEATQMEPIYAIINNAGLTFYGHGDKEHMDKFKTILQVNFYAIMQLTLLFLSYFKERDEGAILNITSLGGSLAMPYQAAYSASKHAAQAFSECMYQESKKYRGIVISTFAPGGIQTEMQAKSGLNRKIETKNRVNMKADNVARKAINSFKKKMYFLVPGIMNKMTLFLSRLAPRKWISGVSEMIYRPPEEK